MREAGLKIKPVFMDGFGNGCADQQIDRETESHTVPDFGGGDAQGESAQLAPAERFGEGLFGGAGAGNDDELGVSSEFGGVAPFGQLRGVIGADEIVEGSAGMSADVVTDSQDGIGDTPALDFLVVDGTLWASREGKPQQSESLLRRSEYGIGFERGLGGGNKAEPVKSEFFASRLGDEKVSEVHRVEGATI
jgi:hypothetical protein